MNMEVNKYPELMSEKHLAETFRKLEERDRQELYAWIGDPDRRVELLEQLTEGGNTQRRCAILLLLSRNAEALSSDTRRFLLPYLTDLLSGDSATVRAGARDCAGRFIALEFEQDPSIWQQFLRRLLFIGKNSSPLTDRILAGSALGGLLETVYANVPETGRRTVTAAYCNFFKSTGWDRVSCVNLLRGILSMPYTVWGTMQRGHILGFVRYFLKNDTGEVRLASLLLLHTWLQEGWKPSRDFADYLRGALETINSETAGEKGAFAYRYISAEIIRLLQMNLPGFTGNAGLQDQGSGPSCLTDYTAAVLYRENLDSGVPGIVKWINLMILRDKFRQGGPGLAGYGSHLLVFLRLNTEAVLFRKAGDDLIRILDSLEEHQKQEIMAELFKCAELQDDSTHYLPFLIGQCWFRIPTALQLEMIPEMQRLCNSDHVETMGIITAAACEILRQLTAPEFGEAADAQEQETVQNIRRSMSGILCRGTYSDRRAVAASTVYTIGYDLFRLLDGTVPMSAAPTADTGGKNPGGDIRERLVTVSRSVLLYLQDADRPDPLFQYLTVQEIARYLTEIEDSYEDPDRPVAFFSGSFDPFSNGDRAVAREIAEMGFHIYIHVNDFSLTRNAQPLAVRRKIVLLSIADLAYVRIFPQSLVINPEKPADLQRLRGLFPGKNVYLVCSSDRIESAQAYRRVPSEGSVHSFPHILYTRSDFSGGEAYLHADSSRSRLTGEVIELKLPVYYGHMTSWQIRHNLQEGRGIDDLVTIPASQYIRREKLYTDERVYKKRIETRGIETSTESDGGQIRITLQDVYSDELLGELRARVMNEDTNTSCSGASDAPGGSCPGDLEIFSLSCLEDADGTQSGMVLDEALLVFQAQGCRMVYIPGSLCDPRLLKERGFIRVRGDSDRYCTDLRAPMVLFDDVASRILEPYAGDPSLEEVFRENERNLRLGIAGLYPGSAVLYLNRPVLNDHLVRRIRKRCGLPEKAGQDVWTDPETTEDQADMPELLSDRICVPFGKFQRNVQIPGIATMALNTEKVYSPDLQSYDIRETPGAPDLSVQMSTLKSMDRPFIMMVDFYNTGYWLQIILQGFGALSLQEEGMIVGAITGNGRRLAEKNSLKIDAVYEIPRLKAWFRASDLTPFYGGDRIRPARTMQGPEDEFMGGRLPSIYPVLPYQMPAALRDAPYQAVYDLSMICLENTRRLFTALEALYESRCYRRLTLERLGEVIDNPGFPETAAQSPAARKQTVSDLLLQDIIRLKRMGVGSRNL